MSDPDTDEYGRPEPQLQAGEVETLLGFLDYQRATLDWKCRGLGDAQLQLTMPTTALSLGGLLQHLARVEDNWFSDVVGEQPKCEPWASMPWAAEWENAATHTGDELRRMWAEAVQRSRAVVAERLESGPPALDDSHPAWDGQAEVSLRWVLVHMIEEYARHNGHADLLREAADGETGE